MNKARGHAGRPRRYPASASPNEALLNLRQQLGAERWGELMKCTSKAMGAGLAAWRVPRLRAAMSRIDDALQEFALLWSEQLPPTSSGPSLLFLDAPVTENPLARKEVAAHEHCLSAKRLLAEAVDQMSARSGDWVEGSRTKLKMSAIGTTGPGVAESSLAAAVAHLDWVNASDLVQLAVFLEADPPFAKEDRGEVELRRKRWDRRLSAARRNCS